MLTEDRNNTHLRAPLEPGKGPFPPDPPEFMFESFVAIITQESLLLIVGHFVSLQITS